MLMFGEFEFREHCQFFVLALRLLGELKNYLKKKEKRSELGCHAQSLMLSVPVAW
jgi:hypothetical protein